MHSKQKHNHGCEMNIQYVKTRATSYPVTITKVMRKTIGFTLQHKGGLRWI